MIALSPGIFSNCLSAVTIGKLNFSADAALMASGSLIFIFSLISTTFLFDGRRNIHYRTLVNKCFCLNNFFQCNIWFNEQPKLDYER
jgi:hypothetical protein